MPRRRPRIPLGLILAALGALGGVLLFDLLIMPMFVRRGAETEVPDLAGLPATQAERLLSDRGLCLGEITRSYDDAIETGLILRHHPPSGMSVKRGRAVDLMVSLGPEALRVPELEGEGTTHARFLLQRQRLVMGRVRTVESPDVERECVIASQPPSGTRLAGRTRVDLLVSSGPSPARYIMPDLRGAPAEEAERMMRAAGFVVQVSAAGQGQARSGEVARQSPDPGWPVRAGEEVELAVAR